MTDWTGPDGKEIAGAEHLKKLEWWCDTYDKQREEYVPEEDDLDLPPPLSEAYVSARLNLFQIAFQLANPVKIPQAGPGNKVVVPQMHLKRPGQ